MRHRFDSLHWLVVAATLLAAFSRFHRLFELPPAAWVDEVWFGLRARELVETGQFQIFYPTFWGGVHPLFVWLTGLAHLLGFGREIAASRIPATTATVLSLPLAYAALNEALRPLWLRPRRRLTAALAALVLSNLLYSVVVSRVGTEPGVALLLGVFCIWQMLLGARTGRWRYWLLAGAAAGLAQYLSLHARFILPVLAWIGLEALLAARPAERGRVLARGAALVVAAALAALPLGLFFLREPQWFWGRAQAVTAIPRQSGPAFLLENAWLILRGFSLLGDGGARDNLAGQPMFDWVQSAGFWIGALWMLWKAPRSRSARILLVWAGVMALPSLLSDEAPQFERMIGLAVPAGALVVAGWLWLWDHLAPRLAPAWVPRARLVAGLLLTGSLAFNGWLYFVSYATSPQVPAALTTTPVRLARDLLQRVETESVFVERILEAEDVFAFDFLLRDTPVVRLDYRQCLPLADRRTARTTYLVLAQHDQLNSPTLQRAYPQARVTTLEPETAALMGQTVIVEVPAGMPAPAPSVPLEARFEGMSLQGYDWNGPRLKAGDALFLTLYWRAEANFTADLTAFLHVGADAPLLAQRDGQPCQGFYPTSRWQPGDRVPDGFAIIIPPDTPPGQYPLAAGWYRYPSLERLALLDADQALPENRVLLGTLTVTAP